MNCAEPEETERRTELPAEAAKYTSACLLASKREFRTYTLAILSCPEAIPRVSARDDGGRCEQQSQPHVVNAEAIS